MGTPRAGGTRSLTAVAAAPYVLALIAFAVVVAVVSGDLPDELGTHFGLGGDVDGTTSLTAYAVGALVPLAGLGTLFAVAARRGREARSTRFTVVLGWGVAGFIGYIFTAVAIVNRGLSDGTAASFPLWQMGTAAGVGLLSALLGRLLIARVPVPEGDGMSPRDTPPYMELRAGERAVWTRTAVNEVVLTAGVALAAVGAARLGLYGWSPFVLTLPVGALLTCFGRVRVRVDARGLRVRFGVLPWPEARVPLDAGEALVREISPLGDFGGWGYRVRPARSGVVVRGGEALAVKRRSGREFSVTVDDARTGAALFNALARREKVS
ncbi:DUF1648 domain-containing protein [Streptomyces sp. NPDC102360]|uniref:DUF1648 domain-containing protein n=1 Tax=Streptomyces sp. NPDC102360 TaxID=3366160 RepID=UPI003806B1E3